ncbi:hypothetical protein [Actinomadura litoris]|uniref:hypothetical protein n=1 Tax=Actinomadura litoris TaxID=2678616 RepID=UPI001FA7DD2D|nr:hypothetical protein [Actinomadura litoris]
MADRRRVVVSGATAARARALPQATSAPGGGPPGAEPSGAGHDPAGRETADTDPPDPPCPSCSVSFPLAACGGEPAGRGGDGARLAQARALIRVQLRAALTTGATVMIVVTGLPLLLALAPALGRLRADGVPLAWAVLALGIQPVWVAASLLHLRRAEGAERALTRQTSRTAPPEHTAPTGGTAPAGRRGPVGRAGPAGRR